MAHRILGQGNDGDLNKLPVEDHKAMVGERQAGGLVQVPHRCEDQGPRGHACGNCKSRVADEVASPITTGAGGVLEGQAAAAEAVRMAHTADLHRTRRDLSQTSNRLLLETSERDGTETPAKRVLAINHQVTHAAT